MRIHVVVEGYLSMCYQLLIATTLDLYFIYSLKFKLFTVDQFQYFLSLCSFLLSGRAHITYVEQPLRIK